jgi:hypothetical protein
MITDLLVAGLMVAVAPDVPAPSPAKHATPERYSEASGGRAHCSEEGIAGSRAALLEAHATYAALSPFSLARQGGGSATPTGSKAKNADGCKS